MKLKTLKIGTRGSPLALKQADMVVRALNRVLPDVECESVIIKTSGDWKPQDGETPLPEDTGGKGHFAKEIEAAIAAGAIDCGVHSAKDMPGFLPDGLQMEHYLPRHDPRDALLAEDCQSIAELSDGAIIGTCSPRRSAILRNARPDIEIVPLRGNVHTRIMKLCSGKVDATLLAMAGLNRLGLGQGVEHGKVYPIPVEVMLPACGQGAIGIELQSERADLKAMFDQINCGETAACVGAEREVLKILNGSCHTPIAAYSYFQDGSLFLKALVASMDGTQVFEQSHSEKLASDDVEGAKRIGRIVGEGLMNVTPPGLLQ